MSDLFEKVFGEENIKEALLYLSKKKDSCGLDGIYLSQLPDYWERCGKSVVEQMRVCSYIPQTMEEFELLTKKGKKRIINKLSSVDRLLTRALAQQLQKKYNHKFSRFSYAYQEGKSTYMAALQAAEYIKDGYIWIVQIDMQNFFDSIFWNIWK